MAFFAAEFGPFPFGGDRHLAPDVAAKQVAHSFTLAQSVDHRVETALQLAELCPVEDHQIPLQVAVGHPIEGRTDHAHRCRGQPRHDPHQDEAEDQCARRHDDYTDSELDLGQAPLHQLGDRHQVDADERSARSEQPHHHRSAHDSRCEALRRWGRLQRLRRDRTQCELGEQIGAGGDEYPANAHREEKARDEQRVGQAVEDRRRHRPDAPQGGGGERDLPRHSESAARISVAGRTFLERPAQRLNGSSGNPIRPQHQRNHDVGRRHHERDPQRCVGEHVRCRNGDDRYQQDDANSDQIREYDDAGQNDLDAYPPAALVFQHLPQ
ncbi:hypothetical protein DE4576_04489 [Mycobacterium marinum]|nr:hypothetical protein DE4576_04489 [Mycobacterium marinum]